MTAALNPVWHRMFYSCTHMTTFGVRGLTLSDCRRAVEGRQCYSYTELVYCTTPRGVQRKNWGRTESAYWLWTDTRRAGSHGSW